MNLINDILAKPNNINHDKPAIQRYMDSISAAPIATTSLMKPDRPVKSRLVNDPIYMEPVNFVNNITENISNIGRGITGHSNDHDLGRINDFAMRAGALGLAGYLFMKAKAPMTKLMEFVGFGSFFASMTLWPKIFIQKPLQAMYGVDIRQKYIDHEGRKKSFFQDPQYIPWDLYSNEELARIGDRLGVPRGIYNRNEVIKRKAQKIALQGNTLWMLTAGFATPIMSALICTGAEKIISPQMLKMRIRKAENNLKNIDKVTENEMIKYNPQKFYAIVDVLTGREADADMFRMLVSEMSHGNDVIEPDFIKRQLDDILGANKNLANKEYAQKFLNYINKKVSNPQRFKLEEGLGEQILALADGKISQFVFHEKAKNLLMQNGVKSGVINAFVEASNRFRKVKSNTFVRILTPETAEQIRILDRKLYEFAVKKAVIDRYRDVYLGDMEESYAAETYKKITQTMLKVLGVKDNELKSARLNGPESAELLLKKIEALVSNEKAYKNAISKLQEEILKFDRTVLPDTKDGLSQGIRAVLDKQYTELLDNYASQFKKLGFGQIAEHLVGNEITGLGSLKPNLNDKTFRRTWELRNGFYKILHVFDCFKRACDAEKGWEKSSFAQMYRKLSQSHGGVDLHPTETTFKEDLALFKKLVLSSTIADNTVKFGYNNAQFGLYDRMMKLIYCTDFDKSTLEALKDEKLGETTFVASFKKKILDTLSNLGNFQYPHAQKVQTKGAGGWVGDILVRDSLQGPCMDKMFRDAASGLYNSRKWLKIFGGAGAALVAVTLFAQTMFGKISLREIFVRKGEK